MWWNTQLGHRVSSAVNAAQARRFGFKGFIPLFVDGCKLLLICVVVISVELLGILVLLVGVVILVVGLVLVVVSALMVLSLVLMLVSKVDRVEV